MPRPRKFESADPPCVLCEHERRCAVFELACDRFRGWVFSDEDYLSRPAKPNEKMMKVIYRDD